MNEQNLNFIAKAKAIHGDKYDYSKAEYKNYITKVCIICPIHGEFWQTPKLHLKGCNCPKCAREKNKLTTEKFIIKAKAIYGDKYDYSKVEYIDVNTKVCIICPIHGEFFLLPLFHICKRHRGCPKCGAEIRRQKNTYSTEEFITKVKAIHGDKYDYSKAEYKHTMEKITIICHKHGEFLITPNSLLQGHGCPKCVGKCETTEEFITKAKAIHGDKYDYSKVEYKNSYTKICIICPKHGEFWQIPSHHTCMKCGCPICQESHLERVIRLLLENNNIFFEQQKKFDWLGRQSLDFYLPQYNIAIECQGKQHFKPFNYFGGETRFLKQRELDIEKWNLCKKNNIKILYYSNYQWDYYTYVIYNEGELLNKIQNGT